MNELTQIKLTPKDGVCPVYLADAQPVFISIREGIARVQFRQVHVTGPTSGDTSPVVEVVMPLSVLAALHEGVNNQWAQLEKQGIKRIPAAAVAPQGTTGKSN